MEEAAAQVFRRQSGGGGCLWRIDAFRCGAGRFDEFQFAAGALCGDAGVECVEDDLAERTPFDVNGWGNGDGEIRGQILMQHERRFGRTDRTWQWAAQRRVIVERHFV